MALTVLVEAWPMRAADASPQAVRLAGLGSRPYAHRGVVDWWAGIMDAPRFSAALGFGQAGWTGGAIPTTAALTFAPYDRARIDTLAALVWDGADITIWTGDDAAIEPVWSVALKGTVAGTSSRDGTMTITVADLSSRLSRRIADSRFTGTGGIEGSTEARERLKRRSFGRCWGVEARLLDPAANVYEVGDPSRSMLAFDAVRDKGRAAVTLELVGWAGTAAATLDALKAAAAPEGGAAIAPSIACLKWWTRPSGPLTVDLRGETGNGYVETVAQIAARLAEIAEVPVSDVAGTILIRPGAAGLHVDSDSETVSQALDRLLLRSSVAWTLEAAGTIRLSPIAFDPAAPLIEATDASREAAYKPVTRVVVGYRRNHRVHGDGEISAATAASDVVYKDGTTGEYWKPAQPGADVTADNTANDTLNVAGRSAADMSATVDINSLGLLAEALRQDDMAVVLDRRTEELRAAIGDAEAAVTFLREVLVTATGSYAKALLRADADGIFGAFAITANGLERLSRMTLVADEVEFASPGAGTPIKLLTFAGGRWAFTADVYAQRIVADVIERKNIKAGQLTDNPSYSFPDVAVGPGETTIGEIPLVVIGDEIDGKGLLIVNFTQDGTGSADTAMRVRTYIDTGSGYDLIRNTLQGIRVTGQGDARWALPVSYIVPLYSSSGQVRIKVTAQGTTINGGGNTSGSVARDILMTVFSGAR